MQRCSSVQLFCQAFDEFNTVQFKVSEGCVMLSLDSDMFCYRRVCCRMC